MHKMNHKASAMLAILGLLLGSWRSHVALFMTGSDVPLEVYPVRLELLPLPDQKQLQEGIPVRHPDELSRMLEDLLS